MRNSFRQLLKKWRFAFGAWRYRVNPYKRIASLERLLNEIEDNLYYEIESQECARPKVMGLQETLQYIIEKRCSVSRFGDGEFELVNGQRMSFESANAEMQRRLIEILEHPSHSCLCCLPNIFGSLARYTNESRKYWRRTALWVRPLLNDYLSDQIIGDALISRAYWGYSDKSVACKVFGLWKKLVEGKDLLIVEGRFSRLGIGNDLLSGAASIRRIWCPATGAFAKYDAIKAAAIANAKADDLVLLALGATATILAYDLAKEGLWAVDAGHLDVEYMWMKMGATERIPIPGRYVNECYMSGREMIKVPGEEVVNNVLLEID